MTRTAENRKEREMIETITKLSSILEGLSPEALANIACMLYDGGRPFGEDIKPWHDETCGLAVAIIEHLGRREFDAAIDRMRL